jgi:hypothetical protein
MSQSSEDRYQQIMRQIAERRAEKALEPAREKQNDLGTVLDGLDVLGKLEMIAAAGVMMPRANGPKTFSGFKPHTWVGVALWRRGGGYYGYRILQIVGVWAVQDAPGPPLIVVGTKRLRYIAPTYEAEAYHKLLRKTFEPYYDGDASPPPDATRLLSARYGSERRLELRDAVQRLLSDWAAAQ